MSCALVMFAVGLATNVYAAVGQSVEVRIEHTSPKFVMHLLGATPARLKQSAIVAADEGIVLFVPGATANAYAKDFVKGPLRRIELRPKKRGLVVLLKGTRKLSPKDVVLTPKGLVSVAKYRRPTKIAPHKEDTARFRKSTRFFDAHQKENSVFRHGSGSLPASKPKASKQQTFKATKAKVSVGGKTSKSNEDAVTQAGMKVAMILLLVLACGAGAVAYKRRQNVVLDDDERIDVVAVQSMGGKHRLALIETCGDRLLVATSQTDVQLLARLGEGHGASQRRTIEGPPPRFHGVLEDELQRGPTPTPSRDVKGLLKLRATRRQTEEISQAHGLRSVA